MFTSKESKQNYQNSVCGIQSRKLFQDKMYILLCCNMSPNAKRNYSMALKKKRC